MGSPQKPSNPLKDPELPARFARLIIKHMIRLRWSDDQLLRKIRELDSGTRGSLASIARYKDGAGGLPSAQQIGLCAEALGWDESERHGLLYPGEPLAAGQPTAAEFQTQWQELLAQLQRQTNLPYEVQQRRAAAEAALKAEAYDRARELLTEIANATRRTVEHAAEE